MNQQTISRKEQILQALAHMLEAEPDGRITTARLAETVGVSEAALYRHFPSKARMFEGLIEFAEESVFGLMNQIAQSDHGALTQIEQMLSVMLAFTERNPGITRLLMGDILAGENSRLHTRVDQFFNRVDSQLKKVLREAELKEGLRTQATVTDTANLLLAYTEGKITQFMRSNFKDRKSTRLNSSHVAISYAVFCLKKKNKRGTRQ